MGHFKTYKRAPTAKMRRMAAILIENPDEPLGSAMRQAGYSDSQAKNPHQITRTRTWQQLMDEYLPQDKLVAVLAEQLEATNTYILNGKVHTKPDNQARLKAADTAFKLRGVYNTEEKDHTCFSLADLRRKREAGEI